ncbi:hypothetical protein M9H77_23350 [Catharanthus roseus]|uniref:Uncharacterized protein n=1 Tax=Catharanthus roseus TaxID=4058 RepID=A0ACC0AUA5_CATRO|nr:hypothetical protein M9H77_23350 [Catharanthus roseus]
MAKENPKSGYQTVPLWNNPKPFNLRDDSREILVHFMKHVPVKFSDKFWIVIAREAEEQQKVEIDVVEKNYPYALQMPLERSGANQGAESYQTKDISRGSAKAYRERIASHTHVCFHFSLESDYHIMDNVILSVRDGPGDDGLRPSLYRSCLSCRILSEINP